MTHVLVVGSGMAGSIAALAAREAGAQVTVVRRAWGATALSSGAVDVAADPCAAPGEPRGHALAVAAAAAEIARMRPCHPYAILRAHLSALPEALAFSRRATGGLLGAAAERNRFLATPLGTAKPVAMAQVGMDVIDLAKAAGTFGVVHFPFVRGFDGACVAQGLERARAALGNPGPVTAVACDFFSSRDDALLEPHEVAARIEADVPGLARRVREAAPPGVDFFLFPPYLARRDQAPTLTALERELGTPCGETLGMTPSLPGFRLQLSLEQALGASGVRVVDATVRARGPQGPFDIDGGPEGTKIEPDAVVLATGKYVGGGIARTTRFEEPLFGLPVFIDDRPVGDDFMGGFLDRRIERDQAAFRAGVRVDAELRPLGEDGRVASPRLRAAGSVISGYDPASDKTGLGVAVLTGWLAGRFAA